MALYPHAIQRHSTIQHPQRSETRGIVIHWTAGHKGGDLSTLDGPSISLGREKWEGSAAVTQAAKDVVAKYG